MQCLSRVSKRLRIMGDPKTTAVVGLISRFRLMLSPYPPSICGRLRTA
jgi:hypothetical protein